MSPIAIGDTCPLVCSKTSGYVTLNPMLYTVSVLAI